MPIRTELRWYYPIDWPQLSQWVRFTRGHGRCDHYRRPHNTTIICTSDGKWRDDSTGVWRNEKGHRIAAPTDITNLRETRVLLAAAHLDHEPSHNHARNLASLCQRCHLAHDRPHHQAQRRLTLRSRWAVGDLLLGPYPPSSASAASRKSRSMA
jgi:hypothetical protein